MGNHRRFYGWCDLGMRFLKNSKITNFRACVGGDYLNGNAQTAGTAGRSGVQQAAGCRGCSAGGEKECWAGLYVFIGPILGGL